jgi:ABC-type multidrug transport system permease subunit
MKRLTRSFLKALAFVVASALVITLATLLCLYVQVTPLGFFISAGTFMVLVFTIFFWIEER